MKLLLLVILVNALSADGKPQNALSCSICKSSIKGLDKFMETAATEKKIVAEIEDLCSNKLPSAEKAQCDRLVAGYGKKTIKFLVDQIQPALICNRPGFCLAQQKGKAQKAEKCGICKSAIGALDKFLESDATEKKIVKEVEHLCSKVSSVLKKECDVLVATYGKKIVEMLVNQYQPAAICNGNGYCSHDDEPEEELTPRDDGNEDSDYYYQPEDNEDEVEDNVPEEELTPKDDENEDSDYYQPEDVNDDVEEFLDE